MIHPLHVNIYMKGSCVVPLNNNYYRREKIRWEHRTKACGCPGKAILAGNTNPYRISIPYFARHQYLYW